MTLVSDFSGGKKILRQPITAKVGSGSVGVVTSAFESPLIYGVLAVNLQISPLTTATATVTPAELVPGDSFASAYSAGASNVIGLTVQVGASTTISGEVIVIAE